MNLETLQKAIELKNKVDVLKHFRETANKVDVSLIVEANNKNSYHIVPPEMCSILIPNLLYMINAEIDGLIEKFNNL